MTILDLDAIHLDRGAHDGPGDGMCWAEAVALLADEPFSDHPACTSPVIAAFMRSWNDALPDDKRQELKRWIIPAMGTNTGPEDDDTRAWIATDWLVRTQTPAWLRLAGLTEQADLLAGMPELRPDTVPTICPVLEAARKDARAAWAAAGAAARAAAWDAAWAAAGAAARAAAGERFASTVTELQASAHELIERMIAVGKA